VRAERVALHRSRRHSGSGLRSALDRFAADETPDVSIEGAAFVDDCQRCARVLYCRDDLTAISDDTGVTQEFLDPRGREAGDLRNIPVHEDPSIAIAFVQDCRPT